MMFELKRELLMRFNKLSKLQHRPPHHEISQGKKAVEMSRITKHHKLTLFLQYR